MGTLSSFGYLIVGKWRGGGGEEVIILCINIGYLLQTVLKAVYNVPHMPKRWELASSSLLVLRSPDATCPEREQLTKTWVTERNRGSRESIRTSR